jgi:hypothetical protein
VSTGPSVVVCVVLVLERLLETLLRLVLTELPELSVLAVLRLDLLVLLDDPLLLSS